MGDRDLVGDESLGLDASWYWGIVMTPTEPPADCSDDKD